MHHTHDSAEENINRMVEAALTADRDAVNRLLAELEPLIIRYCRASLGRTRGTYVTADDVAQEALLAVFAALPNYRDKGSGFVPFAMRITKNKVTDFHRKHGRTQPAPLDEQQDIADHRPGPEATALRSELAGEVNTMLHTLTRQQRESLFLRLGAGYSAAETAEVLAMSTASVRVTQHRALTKLRNQLDPETAHRSRAENG